MELIDDRHCFACGEKNAHGLKLEFNLEEGTLKTRFKPDKTYQGFSGIVHGGIIGLILDEVMVNLLWKLGIKAVTAEYTIRLKSPVSIGEEIVFSSSIKDDKGRIITVSAEAKKIDGTPIASAIGKCFRV